MPNYRELEARVEHFIEVRNSSLLLPHDAASTANRGLQGLVIERASSAQYGLYMKEVSRFLNPGRASHFMKAHLNHRLGKEFTTGWYDPAELIRENGILLADLGIDMQRRPSRGRFKYFSRRYASELERTYFSKYGEEIEAYNRMGISPAVDINAWNQHLAYNQNLTSESPFVTLLPVL